MDIIVAAATTAGAWLFVWWPWLVGGAVALALLFALIWWLWWRLPRRQADRLRSTMPDTKARADVEDNFRKTIGQLLGGLAVLAGAGFAYFQFSAQQENARQQQENARQQLAASLRQFEQQRESAQALLISNQVSKGFEMLGSDKIEVRLGGIYALEGVMNTSEQYHQPVLEALSAFVRNHTKDEKISNNDKLPSTDIQSSLMVIGRRVFIKIREKEVVDLSDIQIPKANLIHTNLANASLIRANLSKANLAGADLTSANLGSANLSGANLESANLSGANLISTNLSDTNLTGANLSTTNLMNANLREAYGTGTNLSSAHLLGTHLERANLSGANLTGAGLSGANLSDAILKSADLTDAHLSDTELMVTDLLHAQRFRVGMGSPNLIRANMSGANLSGVHLSGINLSGVDLSGAVGLLQAQLDQACGTDVKLDPPLTIKPCKSP